MNDELLINVGKGYFEVDRRWCFKNVLIIRKDVRVVIERCNRMVNAQLKCNFFLKYYIRFLKKGGSKGG